MDSVARAIVGCLTSQRSSSVPLSPDEGQPRALKHIREGLPMRRGCGSKNRSACASASSCLRTQKVSGAACGVIVARTSSASSTLLNPVAEQ
jgi:hypothetical protein